MKKISALLTGAAIYVALASSAHAVPASLLAKLADGTIILQ